MDTLVDLHLIGFSHRTAPVAVREQYAVRPGELQRHLEDLVGDEGVHEALVLSTCNRTEVLVLGSFERVRRQLFRNLPDPHLYRYQGLQAVIHLFRVAAGLDSLVLGETEILGQLRRAYEDAREAGATGKLFDALLPQALRVGKRVRSETEVGLGTLSVARVGIDMARRVFGSFENVRALVVGAGQTGLLVARHLTGERVRSLAFANRSLERAREAAAELGGTALGLDGLPAALREADLVVTCVDGGPALRVDQLDRRHLARRDRPLLVVDLSVPRAVEEGVADLEGVIAYDLDDLEPVVAENRSSRDAAAAEEATTILVAELHKFASLRTYASFSPVIAELRRRFDEVREATLDAVAGEHASPRELELAHELERRLLDVALAQMKAGARSTRSEESLDREYRRFLENL